MAILGVLGTQVTADTSDFERGMQRTRQEVDRTTQTVSSAARQWQASIPNTVTFGAIGTENIATFLASLDEASARVDAMRAPRPGHSPVPISASGEAARPTGRARPGSPAGAGGRRSDERL